MKKIDWLNYFLLFIIASLFVFDLFLNTGEPTTMDGRIHITSITQFSHAIRQGDFPVIWLNDFANYGLPVGIFSHQLPLYLGAVFELVLHDPVLSTNLVTFLGIVLANWLFYYFLRFYVSPLSAFLASVFLTIAPYRILNVYIRGAVPETFSTLFLPLILICLYFLFEKKKRFAFFLLVFSIAGLTLTHPMMLLIYSMFIIPYGGYLITKNKTHILLKCCLFAGAYVLGLGLSSYYLLPLFLEKKYFQFGHYTTLLNEEFFGIQQFFGSQWYYFYQTDIATRGHVLQVGLAEIIIFFAGIVALLLLFKNKKKDEQTGFFLLTIFVGGITLFLLTPSSIVFYSGISPLQNIQFPWRMMSLFIFIPPIILALLVERTRLKWLVIVLIIIVAAMRFPQLYGKNYTFHSYDFYATNLENLHSVNMNTLWTGKTEEYPERKTQAGIVDGEGILEEKVIKNSYRNYIVNAETDVRLVDYTFYFPGWKVIVDKQEVPIEFQDPQYRGIITYRVPPGEHVVEVVFADTQIRRVAKLSSLSFAIMIIVLFVLRKPIFGRIMKHV